MPVLFKLGHMSSNGMHFSVLLASQQHGLRRTNHISTMEAACARKAEAHLGVSTYKSWLSCTYLTSYENTHTHTHVHTYIYIHTYIQTYLHIKL